MVVRALVHVVVRNKTHSVRGSHQSDHAGIIVRSATTLDSAESPALVLSKIHRTNNDVTLLILWWKLANFPTQPQSIA